jgi:hypothetical protein
MGELVSASSQTIADKVRLRGDEMSFVGYRKLGLETNLGEVSVLI